MLRLCSKCSCELNGSNTAKKDARRYRKVCKSCYRRDRKTYRQLKRQQNLEKIINEKILLLDFRMPSQDISFFDYAKGYIYSCYNYVKNKLRRM
jgi:hypothetical protein